MEGKSTSVVVFFEDTAGVAHGEDVRGVLAGEEGQDQAAKGAAGQRAEHVWVEWEGGSMGCADISMGEVVGGAI